MNGREKLSPQEKLKEKKIKIIQILEREGNL
jgi:hypothetical protein